MATFIPVSRRASRSLWHWEHPLRSGGGSETPYRPSTNHDSITWCEKLDPRHIAYHSLKSIRVIVACRTKCRLRCESSRHAAAFVEENIGIDIVCHTAHRPVAIEHVHARRVRTPEYA